MLTLHRRTDASETATSQHPWEAPHAAPEDRAVGLELELIELVHQRDEVSEHNEHEKDRLDLEILQVLGELDEVADQVASAPLAG